MRTAVEANGAVLSRCAPKLDAQAGIRHRANIVAAAEALASADALEEQRKATVADAQAAATAAGEGTAHARKKLLWIRGKGARRRLDEAVA